MNVNLWEAKVYAWLFVTLGMHYEGLIQMINKLLCFMFGHIWQTTNQIMPAKRLHIGPPPYKFTMTKIKITKTECIHCGERKP